MFVIEASNSRGWRWISAICRDQQRAIEFLASIPPELQPAQRMIEVPACDYPLFIVEDDGFEYGSAELVRRRLSQLRPCGDEDAVLLNAYIVREDFLPDHPGRDCMGHLYHWHITDDALRPPRIDRILEELVCASRQEPST